MASSNVSKTHILESLLAAAITLALIRNSSSTRAIAFLVVLVHFIFSSKLRFPNILHYASGISLLASAIFDATSLYWISIPFTILGHFWMYAFRVIELPSTNGPYNIGIYTETLYEKRGDFIYDTYVEVHFPTSLKSSSDSKNPQKFLFKKVFPYADKHIEGLSRATRSPKLIFESLAFAEAMWENSSEIHKSPSENGWPLILFSHGLSGSPHMYTAICRELASHGFIVVVPLHNDGSASYVRLYDGSDKLYELVDQHKESNPSFIEMAWRSKQAEHRASEIVFCLDWILGQSRNNEKSPFFDMIDEMRIAAVGHSFGGATVITAGFNDKRIASVVNLDGWMEPVNPKIPSIGLEKNQSLLTIFTEQFRNFASIYNPSVDLFINSKTGSKAYSVLQGTRHHEQSDINLYVSRAIGRLFQLTATFGSHKAFQVQCKMIVKFLFACFRCDASSKSQAQELDFQQLFSDYGPMVEIYTSANPPQKYVKVP